MDQRTGTASAVETGTSGVRRARAVVLAAAVAALVAKTVIAAVTRGPADVRIFDAFAAAIARVGPLRIYEHPMPQQPVYNHPPLTGWMLLGFDELRQLGIPFGSLIRAPATLADLVSALLVLEILRRRRSLGSATACAVGCALSPVLLATSGHHGNTDSVAVMFAVLAAYLLADRRRPLAAGVAAAVAVGVKLIPVVAVPALLVAAARGGRPVLVRFAAGLTAALAVVWGPAVATVPEGLWHNVLAYEGGSARLWGLVRFADWAGASDGFTEALHADFPLLFVGVCAAAGVWCAWVRPASPAYAVALSTTLLLLLSTASAVQYLAWPVVGLFLFGAVGGWLYSAVAGAAAVVVYAGASAVRWDDWALHLAEAAWLLLAAGIATGLRRVLAEPPPGADGRPPAVVPRAATESAPRSAPTAPVP
ncbi:glycosyltransferase 87 family protein [Streptomyces zhihengii]|uniref:Glycosyltransferase family 39 protein n=1 Tax=Streptomyces zhihengii TaxID=1818004 RepID=A0ABS2UUT2_9ACTN|nr:glycosyltransferase 87 family protein [Streptomyces zhihengii]MBM9621272.1 glycosyltransferase family 39 protein [Streptomyces zhihengii]